MRFNLPPHIPVRITMGFWIVSALLGLFLSMNIVGMFIWIGIIFVSVLVHEYGHALTSHLFGQHPHIELVPFGGVTFPEGKRIKKWQEFIVVLNGPLFGFMLFVIGYLLLKIPSIAALPFANVILIFRNVNLFWTIINLLPIIPLDGGHLLRISCQGLFKEKGIKISLLFSLFFSIAFCLFFFLVGNFLIGAIFILFAFQSFEGYRRMKHMSAVDEDVEIQESMQSAELAMKENRKEDAEPTLIELIESTKKGMIFTTASEYLAQIYFEKKDFEKVYALLKGLRKEISLDSLLHLHEAAFLVGDNRLTLDLAGVAFQQTQNSEVALRSAKAALHLRKHQAAIGWAKAAKKAGLENFDQVIKDALFDSIRSKI
ncbi:MAG: site-2 protease family protein [Simkaniaceae bacterium]